MKILEFIVIAGILSINGNYAQLTNQIEVCTGEADVVLVLDRSGSVGDADYPFLVGFSLHLARTFKINEDQVRLGVASYSTTGTREINLNTFGYDAFSAAANQLTRGNEDFTNIHAGLLRAEEMLEDEANGARPGAIKLIVITNDGAANRGVPPIPTAERIHAKNISIVSIGIENDVAPPNRNLESKSLASGSENYYFVPKYTGLADEEFLKKVTKAVCKIVTVREPDVDDTETSIYEDTQVNTEIHTIPLTGDALNLPVYTLQPQPNLPFTVNANGKVVVTGPLDRETQDKYVFIVTVTDLNLPAFTKDVQVTVYILDKNDNTPVPAQLIYNVEVYEDVSFSPPTEIQVVSASDADIGVNAALTYVINSGNNDGKFSLDASSGSVTVVGVLDRETRDTYQLIAVAKDGGNPQQTSVDITINIKVLDRNDNAPTFPNAVVNLVYPETQALGNLEQLVASDLDIGTNGQFEYFIESGNGEGKFAVNQISGYITLENSLDFETTNSYQLIVKAQDKGQPKQSSTVTVNIQVTDADESLTIDGPHSQSIPEDFNTVDQIVQVTANDPENAQITYSIVENSPFAIDSSGIIRRVGSIDREGAVFVYVLTVEASAGGHTVTTQVTITVTDVNDETPVFGQGTYTGNIDENSEEHAPVNVDVEVSATDNDATSPNHLFMFSIISGNTNDAFKIDANTGVVSVNNQAALDFEQSTQIYDLVIQVTDRGSPALSSTAIYRITLNNLNDNTPTFPDAVINRVYPENKALGDLFQLVATDLDIGLAGEVEYTIITRDDVDHFTLNKDTGYLRLLKSFDFEVKNSYQLIVKAEDKGQPRKSSTVTINIQVSNVEEPLIIDGPHTQSIPENFNTVDQIVQVTATDPENAQITYSIVGNSPFAIDSSGIIRRVGSIDREGAVFVYVLTVEASAGGSTVPTQVTITVTDVNDNTPAFGAASYSGSVMENAATGTLVATTQAVSATDGDATSPNKDFMFSIMSGNTGDAFTINPLNGAVSVNKPEAIDYESATKVFNLVIKVTDKGQPQMSSTVNYQVTVNDVNDHEPTFPNAVIDLTFPENQPLGNLHQLQATDLDTGLNGMITYTMTSGNAGKFSVDPASGFIKLNQAFDFEVMNSYQLIVKAEDQGQPKRYSTVTVNIQVTNVVEPLTIDGPHSQSIPEDFNTVDQIVQVTANDPENAQITYSIVGNSPFAIDSSGIIRRVGSIDREGAVFIYVLTVEATASGRTVSTEVTITVTDINDETPVFGQTAYTGNVNEHAAQGTAITASVALSGSDNDATSPNNQFSYMIESGNTNNAFTINPNTGVITVNKPNELDFESQTRQYTLVIKITDQGNPQLSSTTTYTIGINNINDNQPIFSAPNYAMTIPENTANNANVLKVSASDDDGEALMYSIPAGLPFSIDPLTGQITVTGPLDVETQESYGFKVSVSDGTHIVTSDVVITLSDVNDKTPTFSVTGPVSYSVKENAALEYVITTMAASDMDKTSPNNQFMFMILSGNEDGKFEVKQNGNLVLKGALNYNVKNSYQLIIKVEDKGTNPTSLSSTITVNINVMDVNLNAPQFVGAPYTASVDENVNSPMVITVTATDADGPTDQLTFSIVTPSVPFQINPDTGKITATQTFDSEVKHEFMFTIKVTDEGGLYDETTVKVTVNDINDMTPVFVSAPSQINDLSENTLITTVIATYQATDGDRTSPNRDVMYMITSESVPGIFEIDSATGELKLKSVLDFETVTSYTITIRAADKGSNVRFVDKQVTITIKNENEHAPKLDQTSYVTSVLETEPVDYQVLTVIGTDQDANSVLTYSIPDGIPFSIDSNGVITLKSLNPPQLPLNFEMQQQYVFDVTVEDEGGLKTDAPVTINVLDANDNNPIFDPTNYEKYVDENIPVNSEIVTVSATDMDSGNNGMIMYSIVEGNIDNAFTIDQATGKITVNKALDFETTNQYVLKVEATDKGASPRSSTTNAMVTIHVKDVNEKPMFPQLSETIIVLESSNVGLPLHIVSAEDLDSGVNGMLVYSIVSGNEDLKFRIDAVTGTLLSQNPVDFETKTSYVLTIRATDKGTPALSTDGKDFVLTINIGDVNEEPKFTPTSDTKTISETTQPQTVIYTVTATDPDQGLFGMVTYEIISGDPNKHFMIDPATGKIKVNKVLDFKTQNMYLLKIRATDKGENTLHTGPDDFMLKIILTDDNNNAPVFNPDSYTETISETLATGGDVAMVTATDSDSGSNGEIKYSIVSGNVGDVFQIDELSGKITLKSSVDHETINMYTLVIRATDGGSPAMTSGTDATVKVIVSNANEHAPVITNLPYTESVGEEMDAPMIVFTVTATDQDNDAITFSIDTNGPFTIDANTGVITTTGKLDRETTDKYVIKVTATDGNLSTMKSLTVMVTDKNDNKPVMVSKDYQISIPESEPVDSVVVTVEATDMDIGDNGMVMYMIIAGNELSHFKINKNTGAISVAASLDFEQNPKYMLTVRATDKGQPAQHSGPMDAKVTITITDENDNAPVFGPVPAVDLPESTQPGIIATVTATDADSGDSGKIMYAIVGGNGGQKFSIDMNTGVVSLIGELDFETVKSYKLTIRATDKGNPSKSSQPDAMLVIRVTDVNDNNPGFTQLEYTKTISENAVIGTPVVKVSATDADSGVNKEIMYSITAGNDEGKFEIDMMNGQITLKAGLDFSTTSWYTLTVKATDKGTPANYGEATVKIQVTDENNNRPIFNPEKYTPRLREDTAVGAMVTTVTATDADTGKNGEIMYSIISGNDDGKFEIDAMSGKISLKKELNFEDKTGYTLVVRATDKGDAPMHSNPDAMVTVTILDINDNGPTFEKQTYMVSIPETTAQQTVILTVKATDEDSGLNGEIMYAIVRGDAGTTFSINMNTGEITLTGPLNILTKSLYQFVVSATDKGTPANVVEIDVTVKITDVNQAPVITPNGPFDILDNKNVGEEVFTVVAVDTDLGQFGTLMYEITEGNQGGMFTIDMNTGKVTVSSSLTTSTPKQYKIKVMVSDKGSPSLSAMEWFVINVNPSNHQPTITPQGPVTIKEDAAVGSYVITVVANDQDAGDNGKIMYAITGGNADGKFQIDMNTGKITVNGALDASTTSMYSLQITVTDKGSPALSATVPQVVMISAISPPVFTNGPFDVCITEEQPAGTVVLTALATDADNDNLIYSLAPQFVPFVIDPQSGVVTTSKVIDLEFAQPLYFFGIFVTDGIHTVRTNATVCINNINDNAPVIQVPNTAEICEDASLGSEVWQMDTFDPDNDPITATIVSSVPVPFAVDNTGKITLDGPLDFETKAQYLFKVTISDGTFSTTADITVNVCDINEYKPVFAPVNYDVKVPDGSQPNTYVTTVTATDQDSGINGMIMYSIVAGNTDGTFTIDPNTGKITLTKAVDAATIMMYTLTVRATDKGVKRSSMSSSPDAMVKVTIMKQVVNTCSCQLPNSTYPCIKWTKYEIIRKFEGSCYVDKLKKAIQYITAKIENVTMLTTKFTECKAALRSDITTSGSSQTYPDLFARYDMCTENLECKLSMWKMQLEQKKMMLEKEMMIEKEGWGNFNIPAAEYYHSFWNFMKMSQSSRTSD